MRVAVIVHDLNEALELRDGPFQYDGLPFPIGFPGFLTNMGCASPEFKLLSSGTSS